MSAIGTLIQAYQSISKPDKEKVAYSKKRIEKKLSKGGKKVAEVIDPELLKTLSEKVQTEYADLISVLESKSSTLNDQELAITRARKSICFYLKEIKAHNNHELPTMRLKKLWESHECTCF